MFVVAAEVGLIFVSDAKDRLASVEILAKYQPSSLLKSQMFLK
jgi:hypothetical protein